MLRRSCAIAVSCGLLWLACVSATAVEPAVTPSATQPELQPDGDLLARITTMPDNSWLKLPPGKVTGDLAWLKGDPDYLRQGPRVRDYCNKMVWAPERKRALYCGAGHNIHPRNDVWEFDLAANTWVCLYGADILQTAPTTQTEEWARKTVVLRDGAIRTVRGAPVRPAHTWWGLCYDTDRRRLVFWDAHKGLIFTNRKAIAGAIGLEEKADILRGSGSGPGEAWVFTFYPETRQWGQVLTKAPKSYESSELEYLPGRKTLWLHSGPTYVLDEQGAWKQTASAKAGPPSGALSAVDPETGIIVSVCGNRTWIYSLADDGWTLAVEDGPVSGIVPASTFCFDSRAKMFVLYTSMKDKSGNPPARKLWLFDARTKKWTDPAPAGQTPQIGNVAGYYDAARNVTVIYGSSETWLYRCRGE